MRVARTRGATDIRPFGPVARHEADVTSGVDFLVTPAAATPPAFPGGLIAAIEELLGREVRITLATAPMSERLRRSIARDLVAL